jgi:hypothetical protein
MILAKRVVFEEPPVPSPIQNYFFFFFFKFLRSLNHSLVCSTILQKPSQALFFFFFFFPKKKGNKIIVGMMLTVHLKWKTHKNWVASKIFSFSKHPPPLLCLSYTTLSFNVKTCGACFKFQLRGHCGDLKPVG